MVLIFDFRRNEAKNFRKMVSGAHPRKIIEVKFITDRQADRQTDRQADRERDRQIL